MAAAIKLLSTDFDETLTEGVGRILPALVPAIRRFVEHNGVVLLASGRILLSLETIVDSWAMPCFLAATNGAVLEHWPDRRRLSARELDSAVTGRALAAGDGRGAAHLLFDDRLYTQGTPERVRYSEVLQVPVIRTPDLIPYVGPGLRAVSWRCAAEERGSLMRVLREALNGDAWVTASHAVLVDVNPCGADKGTALRTVQETTGIAADETLSIGDSPNDVSMLLAAGHRAAVANAAGELKDVATFVAKKPRGWGVLECFAHFGLSG